MADGEGPTGPVGSGAIDGGGGEGGGGARAMLGGSLPPRKRLLAGLKQNGWLAASSGASPAATVMGAGVVGNSLEGGAGGGGGMGAMAAQEGSGGGQVENIIDTKEEVCVGCGVLESGAWRRLKRNGVIHRLCNSCALLCQKNLNCPICLAVYPDVKDPSVWLHCCRCQRSVHMDCEKKRNPSGQVESTSYICPECAQAKKHKEMSNGNVLGTRAKGCGGRVGVSCSVEAGVCASSAAAECSSPCSKKARMHREVRIVKGGEPHEASIERICSEVKTGLGRKGVSSQEAAAAAAAAAAATACRAAQVAKAFAAAKAGAAVKAAAAAKAALDAAALAARAEAQARSELRRNSGSSEITTSKYDDAYLRKDRAEKPEVKVESEDAHGGAPPNIDDEELARQLHRAINSSPRISRSLTPQRRKAVLVIAEGKPAAEAASAWPRTQQPLTSSSEQRHHHWAKHQQTRPRSVVGGHKEAKRLDSRVMKKSDEICQNSAHQQSSTGALKSELADSSTISHVQRDFSTGHPDYHVPMMEGEADCQFGGVSDVYSGAELNHDIRLSDAEVSQAAAMLDEVLMSEEAEQQAAERALDEECVTGYGNGDGAREVKPDVVWQVEANGGTSQNQDGAIAVDAGTANIPSGVSVPFPSDTTKNLETSNTPNGGEDVVDGQCATNGSGSSKPEAVEDQVQETSNQADEGGSQSSLKEEVPCKVSMGSQELDGSPSQPAVAAAAQGQVRHQGVANGMSGGGKGFAGGGHFSTPPSIPT